MDAMRVGGASLRSTPIAFLSESSSGALRLSGTRDCFLLSSRFACPMGQANLGLVKNLGIALIFHP